MSCQVGFTYSSVLNLCHFFSTDRWNITVAREDCDSKNATLPVPQSEEEQTNYHNLLTNEGDSSIWLGITDEATENVWLTFDGKPLNYTKWKNGYPNDIGDFAYMSFSKGLWYDEDAGLRGTLYRYMCVTGYGTDG